MSCNVIVRDDREEMDQEEMDQEEKEADADIAEMCVLNEYRNSRETCETCQLSIVNVSCVIVIPESERPMVITGDEMEDAIEEFASKRLDG